MHLTPAESDRLTLFTIAELARRRRARGRRLGVPEAIALICDEMIEHAWDGEPARAVAAAGRSVLTTADVMDGVGDLVRHVDVDCLFPSGSALVAVDDPIQPARDRSAAAPATTPAPGAVTVSTAGPVEVNAYRAAVTVEVENTAGRPVTVSSHYPFAEANRALRFDRGAAGGMRLDVPAGSSVTFQPGERRSVRLAALAGTGTVPPVRLGAPWDLTVEGGRSGG
jgi:urease subunit gamma/beta